MPSADIPLQEHPDSDLNTNLSYPHSRDATLHCAVQLGSTASTSLTKVLGHFLQKSTTLSYL